jgi:hypothetical protein
MPSVFTCPQGHRWEVAREQTSSAGTPALCPACGAPGESVVPPTWAEDRDELPPLPHPLPPRVEPSPAAWPAPPGYAIVAELGRGGMGTVYRARDVALNRPVALKVIRSGMDTADQRRRFQAEARAAAKLNHPHVVQVYAVGEWQPKGGGPPMPYLALELVKGGSLEKWLSTSQGSISPQDAARLVTLLARAMHHAHLKGLVHRDLKPGNVLLAAPADEPALNCSLGCPKVTDFGLALDTEQRGGRLTQTGLVMGTPAYMAPEQAEGRSDVGPAADVYALGAILYRLLAGDVPFQGETPIDVLFRVRHDEPEPPSLFNPDVPADLEAACMKCLAKSPHARFASAAELADALEAASPPARTQRRRASAAERAEIPPLTTRPGGPPALDPTRKVILGITLVIVACVAALVVLPRLALESPPPGRRAEPPPNQPENPWKAWKAPHRVPTPTPPLVDVFRAKWRSPVLLAFDLESKPDLPWVKIEEVKVIVTEYKPMPRSRRTASESSHRANFYSAVVDHPTAAGTNVFLARYYEQRKPFDKLDLQPEPSWHVRDVFVRLEKGKPEAFLLRISAKTPGIYTLFCEVTVSSRDTVSSQRVGKPQTVFFQ